MPRALLKSLLVAPVLGGTPTQSSDASLSQSPAAVHAAHTAVELKERRLQHVDLTMNVDRQRDAIMDAAEQLAADAWRHFPLRVKLVREQLCFPPWLAYTVRLRVSGKLC